MLTFFQEVVYPFVPLPTGANCDHRVGSLIKVFLCWVMWGYLPGLHPVKSNRGSPIRNVIVPISAGTVTCLPLCPSSGRPGVSALWDPLVTMLFLFAELEGSCGLLLRLSWSAALLFCTFPSCVESPCFSVCCYLVAVLASACSCRTPSWVDVCMLRDPSCPSCESKQAVLWSLMAW